VLIGRESRWLGWSPTCSAANSSRTRHGVGGCPLGHATDDYGRVKGYDGLYISDRSLIPRGIVANSSLSVTALAERNIEKIAQEDF
jgi:cholesterol oxidase